MAHPVQTHMESLILQSLKSVMKKTIEEKDKN